MTRIVAFTKDWNDVPTCTTHVLREMARTRPVLWVESIGTRKPAVVAPSDVRRVWRRLRRGLARARVAENRLRVLAPLIVPRAESAAARWVNRRLAAGWLGRELAAMGPGRVEYWCFVPNAVDLLPPAVGPESPKVIYYCVDDWGKFHNLDGAYLLAKEEALLRRADVVFTPARYLEVKCRRIAGDRVHYAPHGVEYAAFAAAMDPATVVPEDVAGLPRPIVGFYGNLHPWVDFALIEQLAGRRPRWTFVLIGEIFADVARLSRLANVRFLGRREHPDLPRYCKAFDAAMIPYDMTQARMESVNPVKTKELLAAGVPVVAADVPELRGYGEDVVIARGPEQWLSALERQIARTDRAAISRRVAGEDWSAKVTGMRKIVEGIADSE